MFYEPSLNNHGLQIDPFKALVVPRPIGWISTVDQVGRVNLAPFSFFNAIAEAPPMVMFSAYGQVDGGGVKHTRLNVEETGEFIVNIVSADMGDIMSQTSALYPRGVDEMAANGLEAAPSRLVKPPRVASAPAALECRLWKILDLPSTDPEYAGALILGEVVGVHIEDEILTDGRVDAKKLRPLARGGYAEYFSDAQVTRMRRPKL
jgi:flavin reductase (DIM6/NTAB) family NADH-FMN oxidoreductase RutF